MQKVNSLVLIGGGHSNSILLKKLGMNFSEKLQVTLISPDYLTSYSGMLPGLVSGNYSFEDCHIDLGVLCKFVGARFLKDKVIRLNTKERLVLLENHPDIYYDLLSIDTGSVPSKSGIIGAELAISIKPVDKFLKNWNEFLDISIEQKKEVFKIGIIGGGAGGVELSMAIQSKLEKLSIKNEIHILSSGNRLLNNHNKSIQKKIYKELIFRKIKIYNNRNVKEIKKEEVQFKVFSENDDPSYYDLVFLVTNASPGDWVKNTSISKTVDGFISVKDTLQTLSNEEIFATGDISTIINSPRPKAGVFAVRQGDYLYKNIINFINNKKLENYKPQKNYLILISNGQNKAFASRGKFLGHGAMGWIWKLKDRIDQKFMDQFKNLPPKMNHKSMNKSVEMKCNGCGSKLSYSILESALKKIQNNYPKNSSNLKNKQQLDFKKNSDIILGLDSPSDSAILNIPNSKNIAVTVDHFPSVVDDPYINGIITANHCLNDIFAIKGTPDFALANISIPVLSSKIAEYDLIHSLMGAKKIFDETNCRLVGGHSIESINFSFGFTCGGLVSRDVQSNLHFANEDDCIIITKPLGTGIVLASQMRNKAKSIWVDEIIQSMTTSNYPILEIFEKYKVSSCTDISGFGLLGHLITILKNSNKSAEIVMDEIPVFQGAKEILKSNYLVRSSLHPENLSAYGSYLKFNKLKSFKLLDIIFDPQTSGGFLITIPQKEVSDCLKDLISSGFRFSKWIGKIIKGDVGVHLI